MSPPSSLLPPRRLSWFRCSEHQLQLRSYFDLPRNVQLNGSLSYSGRLPAQQIDAFVRLDLGVRWRVTDSWEVGVWGENLLDPRHPEVITNSTSLRTEVPRSF